MVALSESVACVSNLKLEDVAHEIYHDTATLLCKSQ